MPVIVRYQGKAVRIYFRADAAFAIPGVHECLEAERIKYAIRPPANQVLQNRIGYLLRRPVGRPPKEVRRYYANFTYQAASWSKPRRVIATVEWHPGELVSRVGFIVTTRADRPSGRFRGRSANYDRSHHQRQLEAFDCYALASNRREECAQMPKENGQTSPLPPFRLPDALVAIHTSRLACRKVGKAGPFTPVRGHLGNRS